VRTNIRINERRVVVNRGVVVRHPRYNWRDYQVGRRPRDWARYHNFDRGWWQRNYWATHRYHWYVYRRPPGWYYRRWTYGLIFPRPFWARNYWINEYWRYGLNDPPYGYVWVRYGADAVLVDVETGRILRVVYGIYY
jgi:Ni/Co efflux regulator RcnB